MRIDYYSTIITIIWIALIILCMLVNDNMRMKSSRKQTYYLTYSLIFLSSFAEWVGIKMNGNMMVPGYVIHIIKCFDYILTPIAGAAFVSQLRVRSIWTKILTGIIIFNTTFQIISLFTDWSVYVDADHTYHHGPLYMIYMAVYLLITIVVVIQFRIYDKRFKVQNRFTLYLIMSFVLIGIFIQEIFGGEIRTAYLAFTIGAFMMYIHSTEFVQQRTDEHLLNQQIQIKTDALTGLLSRHAYSQAINNYEKGMPDDLVAFSIDVNGLKNTNDTLGHEAGDELICAAANIVKQVYDKYGDCYRTGGDEFVVLAQMDKATAENTLGQVEHCSAAWRGDKIQHLSLSVGYSLLKDHPGATCEGLIRESDNNMYLAKEEYYRRTGLKRRGN